MVSNTFFFLRFDLTSLTNVQIHKDTVLTNTQRHSFNTMQKETALPDKISFRPHNLPASYLESEYYSLAIRSNCLLTLSKDVEPSDFFAFMQFSIEIAL